MSNSDKNETASVTPGVYASQDVPGNFGFVGCDSDQYETREAAEQAALESVNREQPEHSPLPTVEGIIHEAENRVIDLRGCSRLKARTYLGINPPSIHWRNHAEALAEALRGVQWKIQAFGSHWEPSQAEREAIAQALAAYERAKQ